MWHTIIRTIRSYISYKLYRNSSITRCTQELPIADVHWYFNLNAVQMFVVCHGVNIIIKISSSSYELDNIGITLTAK